MTASLIAIALFAALLIAVNGVGGALLDRLRIPGWQSTLERFVFAATIGIGVLSYAVLAIGLLHGLKPVVLGVVLGIAAAFGLVMLFRGRKAVPPSGDAGKGGIFPLVAAAVLGLLGLLTFIAALAPPGMLEWDSLSYHLAAPKTYLTYGRIFYIPYDHHSNFPFTLEMLFTLMLGLGSVGAAKLCHWLCGVLLVASVATFATRHIAPIETGRRVGLVAALLVAGTPLILWEASVAYVDLATALFTWLSLYALISAAQVAQVAMAEQKSGATESVPWLVISAVLMGFALGTKMMVLAFWGMLLLGVLGWHYVTTRRWAKETIPHGALWGGIALLIGAPWYIKTFLYTGNPVYPFYYGLFGGRYWNAENAAGYAQSQAAFGFGKSAVDLLLGPWQVTMEPLVAAAASKPYVFTEYQPFILSPALLALALAAPLLLGARKMSRAGIYLALFAGGVYLFWFFLMQQTRYLIPAIPAVALIGAEALVVAAEQRRRIVTALGGAIIAASLFWGLYVTGVYLTAPSVPVVFGQETRDEYVAKQLSGLGVAELWINQNTPADAKVALFDETRGFYIDRPNVWATPNHAYGLLPWDKYSGVDEWLADFKKRGYTTLLVNEGNSPAQDDGQRWRSLLSEAVAGDKVTLAFQAPVAYRVENGERVPSRFAKVYRIP